VIDVATLKPLDLDTILASVARTGRCVIITEGARTCSFASEIAAGLAEEGLLNLLAPVQRVTGYDVVVPLSRLEHQYMPDKGRIVAAAKKALAFA
jgi:pyruvate dehydrogenase E1 component beta subunit